MDYINLTSYTELYIIQNTWITSIIKIIHNILHNSFIAHSTIMHPMYSTVLCITQIHVSHISMYLTILCISQFYVSHDFMSNTNTYIPHIYKLHKSIYFIILMYSTVLCITHIHVFHYSCISQFHMSHNPMYLTYFMYSTVLYITNIHDLLQTQIMDYTKL